MTTNGEVCGTKCANGERKCFNYADTLTFKLPAKPDTIAVTKENWPDIIAFVHERVDSQLPLYQCFQQVSCCPFGIITPLSYQLYTLYQSCSGFSRISKPQEFYDLPAMYVEGCQVIEKELSRIKSYGN